MWGLYMYSYMYLVFVGSILPKANMEAKKASYEACCPFQGAHLGVHVSFGKGVKVLDDGLDLCRHSKLVLQRDSGEVLGVALCAKCCKGLGDRGLRFKWLGCWI